MAITESVAKLYEELDALVVAGKTEEAKDLLTSRMSELPEDLRAEIMLDMFAEGLETAMGNFEGEAAQQ